MSRSLFALAFVVTLCAQDKGKAAVAGAIDRPSNGLLEMSISHPEPAPAGQPRPGLLAITLKNVNLSQTAHVDEWDPEAQYECEVLDAGGKPVPLTAEGEKLRKTRHDRLLYKSKVDLKLLHPGEQFTTQLDVARLFRIKPGGVYTVKIRRSSGLPDRNQSGKKIEPELGATFVITGR